MESTENRGLRAIEVLRFGWMFQVKISTRISAYGHPGDRSIGFCAEGTRSQMRIAAFAFCHEISGTCSSLGQQYVVPRSCECWSVFKEGQED